MGVTRELSPEHTDVVRRRGWEALRAWSPSARTMRQLAVSLLCANIVLVVTGGAVRLTGSGLGCPTWPRCTSRSFVAHDALGVNGFIEFGNRMLTFVLAALALATWIAALRLRPVRRSVRWLATGVLLGIPTQAVLGGITVLTSLNPWVVSLHLLLSLAIIAVAVRLLLRLDEPETSPVTVVPAAVAWLTRATYGAVWLVLYVGTVVTGSGPHAGSRAAPRNGLSPATVSQLHADLVFLLIGLTAGTWLALRAADGPSVAQRAARWLLGIELAQGLVGFVQYATDLPVVLVAVHVLGAACISATAAWLLFSIREPQQRLVVDRRAAAA